ncbi:MAG: redoxin domain-containing protein [Planctomycetaceae bacterium]
MPDTRFLLATLTVTLLSTFSSAEDAKPKSPLGKTVAEFSLKDYRGKSHSLSDFKSSKLVVVAFLGTECPLAKLYGMRLGQLHRKYKAKGVAFVGVNANEFDSITEIAAHARRHKIDFPVLKDVGNALADRMGAVRTPEVFVLDEKRAIRYWGRIDDQYGVTHTRDVPKHRDLENALDELLAGKPVSTPVTKAEGCFIARIREPNPNSPVTYVKHVAPVLRKRCVECHRPGEIAPFSLTSYKDVAGWAETIKEVIDESRMPPWHADPKHGKFANDRSLTKAEKRLITTWVRNGAPRGKGKVPPLPKKPVSGWQLPKNPDAVFSMRKQPFTVPAEGEFTSDGERRGVRYQYFAVDPGFKEDKWIRMAEVVPGNRAVVHHILVIVRPPGHRRRLGIGGGSFLVGYVPGLRAVVLPNGMAKFVPAGSQLIFQVHYTPIGSVQKDLSKVGLVFADPKEVKQVVATMQAVNRRGLKIPPHAANHRVDATTGALPFDVKLLAFMPHMHLRGKSFSYEAKYADRKTEMLINVPRYDFNWQTRYELATPKTLPAGTRLHCVAHYDNSEGNLNNPDSNRTVRWGDQTWNEMMIGYFDILMPADKFRKLKDAQRAPKVSVKDILRRLDKNGDGKLSKTEVPRRLLRLFDRLDRNKDGVLTANELERIARFLQR